MLKMDDDYNGHIPDNGQKSQKRTYFPKNY